MPFKDKEQESAYNRDYYQSHQEELSAKKKAYDQANKEHQQAYRKAYYQANKERMDQRRKARYQITREQSLRRSKIWHEANKERDAANKKAWYAANIEQRRLHAVKRARRAKITVLQYYSQSDTPFCACCGVRHIEFLTIDHINGNGTKHRKEAGVGSRFYEWLIRNKFPDGYRTLCYNCNCSRGHLGYCPHERREISENEDYGTERAHPA